MKKTFLKGGLVGFFVMLFLAAVVSAAAPTDPTDITGFPDDLYVGDTLEVTASGGTDADNDTITYQYKFYNLDDSEIRQDWGSKNTYKTQNSDAFDKIRVYAKSTTADANSSGEYYEDISVELGSMLEIDDLDVYVDGEKDSNLEDGDEIGEDVKSGSTVNFEFVIKNLYDEDDEDELGIDDRDMEIEDIRITVTIRDIDDGDDLEEESDEFNLDPGDESDRESIEFKIPSKVEEDEYDVEIVVEGEDGDGNEHRIEWVLTLVVEKEKHDIQIKKADLSQSTVSCSRYTTLDVELVNYGRSDEDELIVEVESEELGIKQKIEDIEIEEGDNWRRSFSINIDDDVDPGTYRILTKVYYDLDDYQDDDFILDAYGITDIVVQKCIETTPEDEEEEEEGEEVIIVTPTTPTTTPTTPTGDVTREISFQDTSLYLVLLVGTVLILGLIFLLLIFKLLSS
ncbi:MAG: hypothetical protein PHV16_01235 [Candidatus Nanoarchaeia archaeon]|nr:hypothetical protein [Candidatus Nanoarchaeia archaeon]